MLRRVTSALTVLCLVERCLSTSIETLNEYEFHNRRMKFFRRDEINLDSLPNCARLFCNAKTSLSPSRLGCIGPTLTKRCLCEKAVTPLACVPSGPSSEDNCWYESEDWLAAQCDSNIPVVPRTSMPSCLQYCAINWLRKKGCRSDTRNCFCKLDEKELITTVTECKKAGCVKKTNPDFDVAFWRDQACTRGEIDTYDEATFQAR
jgi:hypothetical protein